jgi:small subunit ribosomal protein S4
MVQRGGRVKVIRRFGTPLPGLTRKEPRDAGTPVRRKRASKKSDYGRRLDEKQKLRFHYGVTERQLRRAFAEARRRPGVTGHELLALLERRLDNVVFRLGLAPTIPAARQLVSHGHVRVNGRRVDIPSQLVEVGDVVGVAEQARAIPGVAAAAEAGPVVALPSYLSKSPDDAFSGRVSGSPGREDVPFLVDDTAIVEFYAR